MQPFQHNRALWAAFLVIIILVIIGFGYLFYLQNAGVPVPVAQAPAASQETVLTGTYVCLPHTDKTKPKECTPGIQTEDRSYYALDLGILIEGGTAPKLVAGTKILAGGVVVPIEGISTDQWKQYPIKGIMKVEEVAKQ